MLQTIATALITSIIATASFLGLHKPEPKLTPEERREIIRELIVSAEDIRDIQLGAVNLAALPTYTLSGGGVSSSAASITLSSLTIPQNGTEIVDSDLSDTFYLTLEPGNRSRQEISSCTTVTQNSGGTATLSGCTRGLSPVRPYTATSTLQFAHAGGTTVVFSDPPQVFEQFLAKENDAHIEGSWTFAASTTPSYNQNPAFSGLASTTFASKGYVDDITTAGASDAATSTKGILEVATSLQAASTTKPGSDSTTAPLAITTLLTSALPGNATSTIPVTDTSGKLKQGWLDLTEAFAFSGSSYTFSTSTPWGGAAYAFEQLTNAAKNVFAIGDTGTSTPHFIVSSKGNVGIGVSTPSEKLDVTGNVNITGDLTVSGSFSEGGVTEIDGARNVYDPGGEGTAATTTAKSITIPAGTLTPTSVIDISAIAAVTKSGGDQINMHIQLGDGTSSTTLAHFDSTSVSTTTFVGTIYGVTANAQNSVMQKPVTNPPSSGNIQTWIRNTALSNVGKLFISFTSKIQTNVVNNALKWEGIKVNQLTE